MKKLLSLSLVLAAFCINTNIRGTDSNSGWQIVPMHYYDNITGMSAHVRCIGDESFTLHVTERAGIEDVRKIKGKEKFIITTNTSLQGNKSHSEEIHCKTTEEVIDVLKQFFSTTNPSA